MFAKLFAQKELVEARRKICQACEHLKKRYLMVFKEDSCGVCKCSVNKKTKLQNSKCPKEKW